MNEGLRQRLDAVHGVAENTSISLDEVTDYMQLHAKQICDAFQIQYGSLIRTALAIKLLRGYSLNAFRRRLSIG
jgi:hypothetical protein